MRIVGGYCFGRFLKVIFGIELEVGFSWVEVGGRVVSICFLVLANDPNEAPYETAGGPAD